MNPSTSVAAVTTTVLAVMALAGCTAKESPNGASGAGARTPITVEASDTECTLSTATSSTGSTTFVVTNNGTKVTEFYVYGKGERVMGEVENISPGTQRKLIVNLAEPGTYKMVCKPGMIGDGIGKDFSVTGETVPGRSAQQ